MPRRVTSIVAFTSRGVARGDAAMVRLRKVIRGVTFAGWSTGGGRELAPPITAEPSYVRGGWRGQTLSLAGMTLFLHLDCDSPTIA